VNLDEPESPGMVLDMLELAGKQYRIAAFSQTMYFPIKVHGQDTVGVLLLRVKRDMNFS
jgi:hypothetical protein